MMEKTKEIRAFQPPKDANVLHSEVEIKGLSSDLEPQVTYDADEDRLARLGKKQVLKVRHHCLISMYLLC